MSKNQSTYIKLIALITMFIDHLGLIVFPEYVILRIIGRISFPLFAYQVGISCLNTGSHRKYILRLASFAIVIHIFALLLHPYFPSYTLNIFFTLTVGAIAIITYINKYYFLSLSIIFVLPYLLERLLNLTLDYGMYGVLLIFGLFLVRKSTFMLITTFSLLNIYLIITGYPSLQAYSLLALIFILKPLPLYFSIPNLTFYLFYPLHLIFLTLLSMFKQ